MSWSGFKKNVGRATTQVMMKTGHVEKTSDREYEVEERRYRTLESASLRLQKEAKGYLDSLRAMTASQMRIAETIDAFYGDSGATDGVSRSYKQAVEDLDAETVKALDGPYRCVTQDPETFGNLLFDEEMGLYDTKVLAEVESELNFQAGNRRNYTRHLVLEEMQRADQLIEFVYRTTVLEPINRFCAYFPDINECIKKRNHKMLDYDSMRSKVKRLVEKPDKDPSKLPRTEKETEMVMDASTFLRTSKPHDANDDLSMSSPPKVLDDLKHNKHLARIQADEDAAMRSVGLRRTSSVIHRVSRVSSLIKGALIGASQIEPSSPQGSEDWLLPPRSPSLYSPDSVRHCGGFPNLPALPETQMDPPFVPVTPSRTQIMRPSMAPDNPPAWHLSMPVRDPNSLHRMMPSPSSNYSKRMSEATANTPSSISSKNINKKPVAPSTHKQSSETARQSIRTRRAPTPFFNPSELEDIMQPLRQKFVEEQADLLAQAKAAYEQLNQQLTEELPQLIDLRVPYLDPSFEALVKIQLRFCAEAYSRMAQVQQYLDASTRDQYASGDLDARVEDVLGQIRELSIAGTV